MWHPLSVSPAQSARGLAKSKRHRAFAAHTPHAKVGEWGRPLPLGLLGLGGAAALVFGAQGADPPAVPEYQLKAAVLLNLARFTDWPSNTFTNAAAPFVIGLVGQDPFGPLLDDTVRGQVVHGHPVQVRRLPVREAATCHVLFVCRSEQPRLARVLQQAAAPGVLTVGDMDGFAAQGGMVNLVLREGLVRFEVNLEATERQGLKISSKVLKYATLVPAPAGPAPPRP